MCNARTKIHKTPLNETESDRLRRVATALHRQVAPFVRELIGKACDEFDAARAATSPCRQTHGIGMRTNREGPRYGHFASHRRRLVLPNRAPVGAHGPHLRV